MHNTTDYIGVNLKFRDRLFRILFADKKYALELYNALNCSHYTNEEELEIRTLEDVVWMKMKNDVAYLARDVLALYEHQSTLNTNMPVRGLLYFADLFRGILKGKHPYGKNLSCFPHRFISSFIMEMRRWEKRSGSSYPMHLFMEMNSQKWSCRYRYSISIMGIISS